MHTIIMPSKCVYVQICKIKCICIFECDIVCVRLVWHEGFCKCPSFLSIIPYTMYLCIQFTHHIYIYTMPSKFEYK